MFIACGFMAVRVHSARCFYRLSSRKSTATWTDRSALTSSRQRLQRTRN